MVYTSLERKKYFSFFKGYIYPTKKQTKKKESFLFLRVIWQI